MLDKETALKYYGREDVQKAIVKHAKNKEIAVRFNDFFGKRPDTLKYPRDVLELAKQGATSFHCSEELWENPLHITSSMKKKDVEELRIGWDIVLDIDCPYWNLAKITTWLLIKTLKDLHVNSIAVKFSGNKGFHIGVPFEALPQTIGEIKTKDMFPEAARNIASYLLDYIKNKQIQVKDDGNIIFGNKFKISFQKLKESTGKDIDELTEKFCSDCNNKVKGNITDSSTEFVCKHCESRISSKEDYVKCPKCNIFMEKFQEKKSLCKCGSNSYYRTFNPLSIIEVDTILISSRHLYRMPFSLHEKSGLASIPIDPDKILTFDKKLAKPEYVITNKEFIDRNIESSNALEAAIAYQQEKPKEEATKNFEAPEEAVPEDLFPPCIKKVLGGVEDGRKRAVFILTNFLVSVGWSYDMIDTRLKEWNENNSEPLREVYINGQTRYHKQNQKKILPPNCANQMYYKDLLICLPDNLCKSIKNPVNYAIRKARYLNKKAKS
jgi:DNA primase catalytic subunit